MIIGSGMIATAFTDRYAHSADIVIYAAGVSNSSCTDHNEFERERSRLCEALGTNPKARAFVYFSTCSILDPELKESMYVQHKLAMEKIVSSHVAHLIVRLPQVAGVTDNPHTLLNFIYRKISRGQKLSVFKRATRNIIDIDDVTAIVSKLLQNQDMRRLVVNVANPFNYSVMNVVGTMERIIGKKTMVEVVDKGGHYCIDTTVIEHLADELNIAFGNDYLENTLRKYYGTKVYD